MSLDVPPSPSLAATAQELLDGLLSKPWGTSSPSVYETGRVVSFTPWLTGHTARVGYLLATQRADGAWGPTGDDGYTIVPTLSAVEALLTVHRRHDPGVSLDRVASAAEHGLRYLNTRRIPASRLPDMPAIELIIQSLVTAIGSVRPPEGLERATLPLLKTVLGRGAAVPAKLLHALEVTGTLAAELPTVTPETTGTIGASPAATAAWLGDRPPDGGGARDRARRYLEAATVPHGGPVPVALPITIFERAWVLTTLLRAGVPATVPDALVRSLQETLGPEGTAAAAGLPADSDTTATTYHALGLAGFPQNPGPLLRYELATHFCTWPGEEGFSLTTNAHVLEAFGVYAGITPHAAALRVITKVTDLLCEKQLDDGSWGRDRWHASPYYAAACCALALADFGGQGSTEAVRRSVHWILETQRPDGSWGHWSGTAEETAYALQILLLTRGTDRDMTDITQAVAQGQNYLLSGSGGPGDPFDGPALWHDKDLYRPAAILRSALISARHLADRHLRGQIREHSHP